MHLCILHDARPIGSEHTELRFVWVGNGSSDLTMARELAETTIINETTQPVLIKGESHAGDSCVFRRLLPENKHTLEYFVNDNNVHSFTFSVGGTMIPVYPDDGPGHLFHPDVLARAEEITIHETLNRQEIGWRISKERGRSQEYQYLADFDAFSASVRKDVSSRTETIEKSCACLKYLLEKVKICYAPCENLVQICSKGVAKMIEFYIAVSENDNYMWGLYTSKKLRHLVSSLDRLISSLESIKELLQACGSQWCRMGLVVSAFPLPRPEKKTFTKFDLLIKELRWNLDTIHYILDLTEDGKFNWNDNECRYVIEVKQETGIAGEVGMELVECGTYVDEARADLLCQIKDGTISRKEKFLWIWVITSCFLASPANCMFIFDMILCGWALVAHMCLLTCFSFRFTVHSDLRPIGDLRAKVMAQNIFGVLTLSMGGRNWYKLSFEFEAAFEYIVMVGEYFAYWFVGGQVLAQIISFLVIWITDGSIPDISVILSYLFRELCQPITILAVFINCSKEIALGIAFTGAPFPLASFLLFEGICWCHIIGNCLREIGSGLLPRENTVFWICVIYLLLLGGLIGILFKIQVGLISRMDAASFPLSPLLCGAIASIHIIGVAVFLFRIKTKPLSTEVTDLRLWLDSYSLNFPPILLTVCFMDNNKNEIVWRERRPSMFTLLLLCWSVAPFIIVAHQFFQTKTHLRLWLACSSTFLPILLTVCFMDNNKNEIVWRKRRPSMFTLLWLCWTVAPVICVAHHLFQTKNGFIQIEDLYIPIPIPNKELFIQYAVCFVLLLRAADSLALRAADLLLAWFERYARNLFPQYGGRRYFEEDVLKGRLQYSGETNNSIESSIAPNICFQIDHEHLKFENKIAGVSPRAIYKGYWRGLEVAIAVTQNLEVDEYNRKSQSWEIQQEIKKMAVLMLRLQHPNIVTFFGYSFEPDKSPDLGGSCDDEYVAAGYLVMELMQGDLRQEINRLVLKQSGRPFTDDVAVDILLQIAGAMSHMHDCGVLYRDLKANNCVVSQRSSSQPSSQVLRKFYTVKLIDFDISKLLDQFATDHTLMRGTTRWMAPEVWGIGVYVPGVLVQKAPYDTSIDVYSFGMTCYEVITGLHPFHHYRRIDEIRVALQNEERPEFPPGMSCPKALEELMSRCWAQKPSVRPNFKEIVKALWTVKYELELQQ